MQKYFNSVQNRLGAAINGASVYVTTYPSGNPAQLYSDNGVNSQANPVITNENGYFSFYAADGRYSLTVSGEGISQIIVNDILLEDPADGSDTNFSDVTIENLIVSSSAVIPYNQGGTGAVSRNVTSKLREVVSVKDFGALGDGVTDNTAAINLAFSYVRSLISTSVITRGTPIKITFGSPGDVFLVTDSINATSLKALNVVIDGGGSVILGKCTGKPVIDALNCRWYDFQNVSIWGDATNTPSYGIQIGRTLLAGSSAGDGSFNNVMIDGYFAKACLYNFTAETVQYNHVRLYNSQTGSSAYCLILDGINDYNIQSAFTTQFNPVGTQVSFNENNFYGCDFRKTNGGNCIRSVGQISRHGFIESYAATDNGDIFEAYKPTTISDLYLDIHAEVDLGAAGVERLLVIDNVNPAANVNFFGLKIRDHQPQCRTAIIDTTGTTRSVLLDNVDIDCGDPANTVPVFGSTSGASKLLVSGAIRWPSSKNLNLSNSYFNGFVYTKDTTVITHTLGSYQIVVRPNGTTPRIAQQKGFMRFYGTSEGVDLSNYIEMRGSGTGVSPRIVSGGSDSDVSLTLVAKGTNGTVNLEANGTTVIQALGNASAVNFLRAVSGVTGNRPILQSQGSDADIDLSLQAKGAGNIRFGTNTANADAPIIGYITIKDDGGIPRKLAIIA